MSPDVQTAELACGCRVGFRTGVEGSPVLVVVVHKSAACQTPIHVSGLPIYDHREALRPSTRPLPPLHSDFEEEG